MNDENEEKKVDADDDRFREVMEDVFERLAKE